jgi:hypothetical protein
MKTETVIKVVQRALTDDLRQAEYRGNSNPLAGHCYVAAEAIYHLLGGKAAGLTPAHVMHEGRSHWFLKGPDGIIDATVSQFKSQPYYNHARHSGFLTRQPSKRAQIVIDRVLYGYTPGPCLDLIPSKYPRPQ